MTIEFESTTYKILAFALPALVNGSHTGLIDEDEAYVENLYERFDSEYGLGCWHIGEVGEEYFGRDDFENLSFYVCDVEVVYKMVEMEA